MNFILLIFFIGSFIGSFLGVIVERTFKNKSYIKGRSYCDFCQHKLNWYDLIPVLSFIFLKGKCRYCRTPLPLFYPAIEITTGLAFAMVYMTTISNEFLNLNPVSLIFNLVIASILIVVFFIDLKYGIIPDKITLSAIVATFLWLLIYNSSFIINHLTSAAGTFLFFVLISFVFYKLSGKNGIKGVSVNFSG